MRVRWSLFAPNAYVPFPVFGWRRVRAASASIYTSTVVLLRQTDVFTRIGIRNLYNNIIYLSYTFIFYILYRYNIVYVFIYIIYTCDMCAYNAGAREPTALSASCQLSVGEIVFFPSSSSSSYYYYSSSSFFLFQSQGPRHEHPRTRRRYWYRETLRNNV